MEASKPNCQACAVQQGTHKPAEAVHQIAEPAEYPEIDPALFSGNGVLWSLIYTWSDDDNEVAAHNVDEHIQSMMRAYVEADRAQRASTQQAVQSAAPLPLLLRDIARDLGITVPQACIALKPLGNYSTNSAVTAEMARMLRDHFPAPAHPAEWVPEQAAKLPPLPEPTAFLVCKGSEVTARAWNVDQMRAYAAAALAATQPADGVPAQEVQAAIDRFDAYFRSANGVPPNARVTVPTAEWQELRAMLSTHPAQQGMDAQDAIRALIAQHGKELEKNEYAYFELAYTRSTGWMAWITDKPLCSPVVNPDRKVLASGQGDTPEAACADALAAQTKQGGAA